MNLEELEGASGGTVKQTKYLKQNPVRRFLIRQYLETIEAFTNLTPAQTVLDVGSGEGFVMRHLREQRPDLALFGVDIEAGVLKVAAYQNPGAHFAVADGSRLPVAGGKFDLVLCNEVLEHLPEPARSLEEIARVGTSHFIFSVPREPHYRLANMLIGANWSRWGDDPDHLQRWTRSQFLDFLGRHFTVVEARSPFPWLMVLCQSRA